MANLPSKSNFLTRNRSSTTWHTNNRAINKVTIFACRGRQCSKSEAKRKPNSDQIRGGHDYHRQLQVTDLLDVYRGLVTQGRLRYDEEQIRAIMELRRLHKSLIDYAPPAYVSSATYSQYPVEQFNAGSWWEPEAVEGPQSESIPLGLASNLLSLVRLRSHADEIASLDTPNGLFLTGSLGSGKSMLIDLWFSILSTPYKARKHYSTLVLETYRGVWEETTRRQKLLSSSSQPAFQAPWNKAVRDRWRALFASRSFPSLKNINNASNASLALPSISYCIARRLLLRHWLLVFDEVQLLDVSSAGLLSDVLSWFWRLGGVIVGSSNKVPDDLYRHGVQRERLEPFVEALKLRCPVLHLRNTGDYRKEKAGSGAERTWFILGQEQEFASAIRRLVGEEQPKCDSLNVFGRSVPVRRLSDAVCQFTFEDLCERSLGSADYISIASRYSTMVLTGVPILRADAKNQGRRFITLIDALYESRCRIICMSEADLGNLFFPDTINSSTSEGSNENLMMAKSITESREAYRPNVSSYNSMPSSFAANSESLGLDSLSIFSGEEERFAYRRAHSRLLEITSSNYSLENAWRPLSRKVRQWEKLRVTDIATTTRRPNADMTQSDDDDDDFATKAANVHSQAEQGRVVAPKIGEVHFWGVREDWGPKAKAWGRGAQVHGKNGKST